MSTFVYARQFISKYKLDKLSGTVILKKNKPVFVDTFYKTRQGALIKVPPNGWVVRNSDGTDVALSSAEFGAQYARHRFTAGSGYATGNPAKWNRYLKITS